MPFFHGLRGRRRPHWWPGDEEWPPRRGPFGRGRQFRARFLRRLIVAALLMLLFVASAVIGVTWLVTEKLAAPAWTGAVAVFLVLGSILGLAVTMGGTLRRVVRPIGDVMEASERVAAGDYSVRVAANGPPPVRALGQSFNTMTEKLQRADRQRRDLMADLAHELRTPLSVLQGRLEGLLDGVYPRDDRHLGELLEETKVLSRLINDLRTLALSDAGELSLELESADLVRLARDLLNSMQPQADARSVALTLAGPGTEVVASMDPTRMREVLSNIVTNAIRHTPAGGTVSVSVVPASDQVTVTVIDTGSGMSPEDVHRAFERFHKGDGSRGSGLGLPIAKGIIAAHGGSIAIASEPGQGTRVTFTVPL